MASLDDAPAGDVMLSFIFISGHFTGSCMPLNVTSAERTILAVVALLIALGLLGLTLL
jgi:hypothetical protein